MVVIGVRRQEILSRGDGHQDLVVIGVRRREILGAHSSCNGSFGNDRHGWVGHYRRTQDALSCKWVHAHDGMGERWHTVDDLMDGNVGWIGDTGYARDLDTGQHSRIQDDLRAENCLKGERKRIFFF
jgi:hypothetical protein